jgi:sulfur carrier protein
VNEHSSVGTMPTVTVNGAARQIADALPLPELLAGLGLKPGTVVVELNGTALLRSEVDGVLLGDGDRLELVRAVAGG